MGYNRAKKKMKKRIVILGLGAILACGTLFAMNHSSKRNAKTELKENSEEEICDECYTKSDGKDALGNDQITVTNNCSYAIVVTFEYWNDTQNKYEKASYRQNAGATQTYPAKSYKNFKCYKA